jgi:hypothetical protein
MADDIYPERFCAFIDILGFRVLVARLAKNTGAVESLREILKEVHSPQIPGVADPVSVGYRTQSISDAVAISTLPTPEGLLMLFGVLNHLTFSLLQEGYFVRGAIVRGRLYHDDAMIFGDALIRAYDLETTVAKYPRIVVHSHVIAGLPTGVLGDSCKGNVHASDDGPFYLNVLSRTNHDLLISKDQVMFERYREIKEKLHKRYREAIDNPAHFEKLKWFVAYWNKSIPEEYAIYRVDGTGLAYMI